MRVGGLIETVHLWLTLLGDGVGQADTYPLGKTV